MRNQAIVKIINSPLQVPPLRLSLGPLEIEHRANEMMPVFSYTTLAFEYRKNGGSFGQMVPQEMPFRYNTLRKRKPGNQGSQFVITIAT